VNLQLSWKESVMTSCLHAAQIVLKSKASLTPEFAQAADLLLQEVDKSAIPTHLFWRNAIPLSAQSTSKAELAKLVLRKTRGLEASESIQSAELAGRLSDLANQYENALPDAEKQLGLRRRPLFEAWEARGPGLLYFLSQQLEEDFFPPSAEVILVLPISGGRGTAHLQFNNIRMEAVLYDPDPMIPEVVRMGWLLSQLNFDLPKFSEILPAERVPLLARLATLPAVLIAAEEVELIPRDQLNLSHLLEAWGVSDHGHNQLAEIVASWWEVQSSRQAPWPAALAALDRMLAQ